MWVLPWETVLRLEVFMMSKVLPVFVTMLMVLSSMGLMAIGKAEAPQAPAPGQTASRDTGPTYGTHSRLSRAYHDLSKWRGVKDTNVSVTYLIVTVDAFVNSAMPLAQWKYEKGLSSAIVTVEDIYKAYGGQDNADRIHNYLRDFRDYNPTFKWLLLLGDSDDANVKVPARHLWTGASYIDWYIQDSTVSDFYYAGLDSNWNLNGDNTWGKSGEVDWTPDVYVGRIPAQSDTMATMDIQRTLNYEKNPTVGNWMRSALLAGALYDVPNLIGDNTTRDKEGHYEWWQDNGKAAIDVANQSIPSSMNKKTMFDYNVTAEGWPPHYWGGNYTPAKDELSQATFVPEFNKGYSIIASASHAWVWSPPGPANYISRGIIDYNGDGLQNNPVQYHEFYYYTDAQAASNGNMLPLWYAGACLVGNWSQAAGVPEETFEKFWQNPNGGVIGLVAAAHGDYRGNMNNWYVPAGDGDTWLLEDYFRQFFGPGDYRPGSSLYLSKIAYRNYLKNDLLYSNAVLDEGFVRDSLFVYCLQGDPEVPVWTALPRDLTATVQSWAYTGQSTVNVTVHDAVSGLPVQNATVSLWGPTVFAAAQTDSLGKAVLTTNGKVAEHVNVTVTAHNYNYLELHNKFNITWRPADLQITPANITFSKPLVKAGDPVNITAVVWNVGETAASSVEVKFYLGDPATGGTEIGTQTIAALPVRGSAPAKVTWNVLDGVRTICVVADPGNKVTELNKKNNKACNTVEGTNKDVAIFPSDITIDNSYIRMDGAPMVANNTTVTLRIKVENKGPQVVPIVYVRLYDGDPKAGGKRIGFADYPVNNIPVAGNNSTTAQWNVTVGGPHWIFAQLDPTNVIHETNDSNNNASRKVYSDFAPVLSPISDVTMDEDTQKPAAFCLDRLVKDPDNTFEELKPRLVSNSNPNVVINITSGGCVDILPRQYYSGISFATIAVSDGVFEVSRQFKVTVNHVNHPPSLVNPGKVTAQEGKPFELTIKVTDPDVGDILTFTSDATMFHVDAQNGKIRFTPVRSDVGTHIITVKVSDGQVFNTTTFTFVVTTNDLPPVLVIKEKEWVFTVGKAGMYTFTVSDPDNDPIALTDTFKYGDVKMPGHLAYTPEKSHIGTYNITISAFDGLLRTNRTVVITVKDQPTKPGITGNWLLIGIILVVVILLIAIVAAVMVRRSRHKEEGPPKDKAYSSLYAADEKRKEREEFEKRREERERKRREEERRYQQDASEGAAEQAAPEAAQATAPAFNKCPKCGSTKIKQMGASEWMCMKCGKIFG